MDKPQGASALKPTKSVYITFPINDLVRDDPRYRFHAAASSTLNNNVSPLFASANFASDIDYDSIRPALQLASLLIKTPCIQGYWLAATTLPPKETKYTDRPGSYQALWRRQRPVSQGQSRKMNKVLAGLAPYIQFKLDDLPTTTAGRCYRGERWVSGKVFPGGEIGNASTITLARWLYEDFLRAAQRNQDEPGATQHQDALFRAYFGIARVIVHELAHAVWHARWGSNKNVSMPFEDRTFSEDGFDWESTVFDGIVDPFGGHCYVKEWPAISMIEHYVRTRHEDVGIAASFDELTTAGVDKVWRIPECMIRGFFQQDFWNVTIPNMGAKAFQVPKLIGYRLVSSGRDVREHCACESCVLMRDFVERANARGNGRLTPGRSVKKLLAEQEEKSRRASHGNKNGTTTEAPRQPLDQPAQDNGGPSPDGTVPEVKCGRDGYRKFQYAMGDKDTRSIHSFAIGADFKSCLDGTVVASKHFRAVANMELEKFGLPEALVSPLRAPEDRMDEEEAVKAIFSDILPHMSIEQFKALTREEGLGVLRQRYGSDAIAWLLELGKRLGDRG